MRRRREYTDAEIVAGSLAIWILGLLLAVLICSMRML